jgi:hypothetical protein
LPYLSSKLLTFFRDTELVSSQDIPEYLMKDVFRPPNRAARFGHHWKMTTQVVARKINDSVTLFCRTSILMSET